MTYLKEFLVILEVLLLFNLLIGVHELGHFLAAKWRGLRIDRFAIWFGKPIWKKKIGGVEYAMGWIPAGGYVQLPQMATMEAIEGKTAEAPEQLPNVSPLDKIIVAFAGPLFSFGLAVAFAIIVWVVGKPANEVDNSTQIGWVDPSGPAGKAGLMPGDTILAVDGHPVHHFDGFTEDSVKWRIVTSEGSTIDIKYLRNGVETNAYPVPYHHPTHWYERKALRQILISSADKPIIMDIASNSPAAAAGLKSGDEIVALNGQHIYSYEPVEELQESWTNEPAVPMTLTIKRGQEQFNRTMLAVKPLQPTNSPPLIGILSLQVETNINLLHPSPLEQIQTSVSQIAGTIHALFAPKSEIGVQQLGGAVMIIRVYSSLLQSDDGWRRVLWFSVVMNVNLALLNMLPLPVLDGGHILLSLIEFVRRRPVSNQLLQFIQTGFAAMLIMFMLYLAFFDAGDWIRSSRADQNDVPTVFAPNK
jgi:regulator of sigma E protease